MIWHLTGYRCWGTCVEQVTNVRKRARNKKEKGVTLEATNATDRFPLASGLFLCYDTPCRCDGVLENDTISLLPLAFADDASLRDDTGDEGVE